MKIRHNDARGREIMVGDKVRHYGRIFTIVSIEPHPQFPLTYFVFFEETGLICAHEHEVELVEGQVA